MSEPEETTVGDRIKFIRGSIPQKEFANTLGVYRNTLWHWESNKGFPDFERLQIIHKIFKVNINWLISGEGNPYLTRLKHPPNIENRFIRIESRIKALEKKAKK